MSIERIAKESFFLSFSLSLSNQLESNYQDDRLDEYRSHVLHISIARTHL